MIFSSTPPYINSLKLAYFCEEVSYLSDKSENLNLFSLTDTVSTILSLKIHLRIPTVMLAVLFKRYYNVPITVV